MRRKKLLSMMLASIMAVGLIGADANFVYADNSTSPVTGEASSKTPGEVYVDTDSGVSDTPSTYLTDTTTGFTLDVTADTVGNSRDIIYSVKVISGTYNYTYDYGMGWDPTSHSYTDTTNGGTTTSPGWSDDDFTAANCELTVENDSNYPVNVQAKFILSSSDTFNATNSRGAVVGLFSKNLSHLKAIKAEGVGGTWTISSDTAEELEKFDLGVIKPTVASGGGSYWYITTNDTLANTATYYFAFSGTPDSGKDIPADDPAMGTIRLDIKPVSSSLVSHGNVAVP